jgi:hypothetical protein
MANPGGKGKKGGTEHKSAPGPDDRQSRQSEALRENLHRRKQQTRTRAVAENGATAATKKKIRPS